MNYYKISEEQLLEFLRSNYKLIALENGGVDNWSFCNEAMSNYIEAVKPLEAKKDYWFYDLAKDALKGYERNKL